nr:hypothetical protein Itr_chr08CG21850 [Ipomoea trifida]
MSSHFFEDLSDVKLHEFRMFLYVLSEIIAWLHQNATVPMLSYLLSSPSDQSLYSCTRNQHQQATQGTEYLPLYREEPVLLIRNGPISSDAP